MKKLEEIPKKDVFEVPEGYFDSLPARISARIEARKGSQAPEGFGWIPALRFAVPVLMVAAAVYALYLAGPATQNPEKILASVSTEALYEFLDESDLSTEELVNTLDVENFDLDGLEENAYPDIELDEDDLDQIEMEFENSQP
jgi:hypothetical protein